MRDGLLERFVSRASDSTAKPALKSQKRKIVQGGESENRAEVSLLDKKKKVWSRTSDSEKKLCGFKTIDDAGERYHATDLLTRG